ncbi:MAG: hemerythrin domain-containing protein [Pseudomonadota bacterium]
MNSLVIDHRTPDGKTPTSVMLLRNPLDFIAEDHLRLRTMCAEMDRLSQSAAIEPAAVSALIKYLKQELPRALADEDDDLMPRVLARAEPEDELPKLVKRLHGEHVEIAVQLAQVIRGLVALVLEPSMPLPLRDALRALAGMIRRHLILENAVLLPLARARLTEGDLHSLRSGMLKRRGLEDLFAD